MTWPWQRAARERDREDEMRAHLELYIEELVGRGVTEADAAREARLRAPAQQRIPVHGRCRCGPADDQRRIRHARIPDDAQTAAHARAGSQRE